MAHSLLSGQAFPPPTPVEGAYQSKAVKDFSLPNGQLKAIPAQRRKLLVILKYIAQDFTPGLRYSENEVIKILSRYHPDTATLRRELVGAHLMSRAAGEYWLEQPENT